MQLPTPVAALPPPMVPLYNGELLSAIAMLSLSSVGSTRSELIPSELPFRPRASLALLALLVPSVLARPVIRLARLSMLRRSRPVLLMFRLIRLVALSAMLVAWPISMPASSRKLAKVMMMNIVILFYRERCVLRPFIRSVTNPSLLR